MHPLRRLFQFITKPLIVLHIILLIQWGIFLYTTLEPYHLNAPDRTYVLLRGHLIYTSLIREGANGAWKTTITHTTRKSPAVYAHLFFIFLGKIAAVFRIDPPTMYMAARMAAAVILFWSTYWFISLVLPPALHTTAIIFALALEPGPLLTTLGWNPNLWLPSIFSYYPQIVSYRHFGLPHHTLGEAVGLLFLGVFTLAVRRSTPKRLLLLGLLGIVGTTILPPYFMIISVSVLGPWLVWAILTKSWKHLIAPLTVAGLSIASVSLFLKYQFSLGQPWLDFNQDEKRWVTNHDVLINYLSTLFLYIPFVSFLWLTISRTWKSWTDPHKRLIILMTCWTVLPALLVYLTGNKWFPLANFRLMDGYNYIPAGILAALGCSAVLSFGKKQPFWRIFAGFIISGAVLSSMYLTQVYTKRTIAEQNYPWTNVFIANDHYRAFEFLKTVRPMSGLFISNHFGEIAPEFAPVRAFIGSTPGYYDWDERHWIMTKFYSGTFTPNEAREVLNREDISYVYYGDTERLMNTTGTLYPGLLTPVFQSPIVTVFKVN